MSYNGWTNYETWVVNLWLTDDGGAYLSEIAEQVKDEENPELRMADILKEEIENGMPRLEGLYGDLLSTAIEEINFDEIGITFMDDYLDGNY